MTRDTVTRRQQVWGRDLVTAILFGSEPLTSELTTSAPADWRDAVQSGWESFARENDSELAVAIEELRKQAPAKTDDLAVSIAGVDSDLVSAEATDHLNVANEIVRFSKNTSKMVIGCLIGGDTMKTAMHTLRKAHIPNFEDLEDVFRTVGKVLPNLR